jgi:hypothetical protein
MAPKLLEVGWTADTWTKEDHVSALFELRLELTTTEAEQCHLAMFATDEHGQWSLLEDWTADDRQEATTALGEASTMVDSWLAFGGRLLPA